MLTFAATAKIGAPERAALGYHKTPGESKSVRAYDRSRLAGPVAELIMSLDRAVGNKMARSLEEPRIFKPFEIEGKGPIEYDGPKEAGPADELSSESDEEVNPTEEEVAVIADRWLPQKHADHRLFINNKSGALHRGKKDFDLRLACGRLIDDSYTEVLEGSTGHKSLCHKCYILHSGQSATSMMLAAEEE